MFPQIVCVLLALQAADIKTEGVPVLDFVIDLHRENLRKLNRGVVSFELLQGTAQTLDDVATGRLTDPVTLSGRFAFNGKDAVYECVASDDDIKRHTRVISKNVTSTSANGGRMLSDGKITCVDFVGFSGGKIVHTPIIGPDRDGSLFSENFQFVYWPGEVASRSSWLLEDWNGIKDGSRSLVESKLNDDGTATIAFARGKSVTRYQIDLQRGAIPSSIVIFNADGNVGLDVRYRDFTRLASGAWIPMTKLSFLGKDMPGRRCKVASYDTDGKMSPKTFTLDFPEPVEIMDRSTGAMLRQVSHLNLGDRRKLKSTAFNVPPMSSRSVVPQPALPGVRQPSRWPARALAGLGLLLLATGVWAAWRRWSR